MSASALPTRGGGDGSKGAKAGAKERGRDRPQGGARQGSAAACPFSGEGGNLWWVLHKRSRGAAGRGIAVVGGEEGLLFNCQPKYEDELSLVWKVADGLIPRFFLARAK